MPSGPAVVVTRRPARASIGDIASDIASSERRRPLEGSKLAELSTRVVRSSRLHTGRGPTACRSSWGGRDTLVTVVSDWMTTAERSLSDRGHDEEVLRGRRVLDAAVEDELRADVEDVFGRPVAAILTARVCRPTLASHVFVLAHEPPGGGLPESPPEG
jgi:uncharacterized protein YbcI